MMDKTSCSAIQSTIIKHVNHEITIHITYKPSSSNSHCQPTRLLALQTLDHRPTAVETELAATLDTVEPAGPQVPPPIRKGEEGWSLPRAVSQGGNMGHGGCSGRPGWRQVLQH